MNFLRLWGRRKMGCTVSTDEHTGAQSSSEGQSQPSRKQQPQQQQHAAAAGEEGHQPPGPPQAPSESQRRLVRDSWMALQGDIARVGVIMFVRLFETHPECKDVFYQFRDCEDLQKLKMNKQLQAHGLRVMSFIEKSVARLEQECVLEQLIVEMGRKHYKYNASPKYYSFVGIEFIATVQPFLQEKWTNEVEDAWQCLFRYIAAVMKRGYLEEEAASNGVNTANYDRGQGNHGATAM
ncbi:neuroglobin-like [Lampetra fluviatilis]